MAIETDITIELAQGLVDNSETYKVFQKWAEIIQEKAKVEDTWIELEMLPGYKFKNLKFIPNKEDQDNTNIIWEFKADTWEDIEL